MTKKRPESDEKGRLLEEIAALLHRGTGVQIETRVKLPTIQDPTRLREIDILLTSSVSGYPVRFSIECKNEERPIGTERIDSFVGKLKDLGLPTQLGIFIAARGFTKAAIRRAKSEGIRLLELRGLSSDRLRAAVQDSLQSLVFLVPELESLSRFEDVGRNAPDLVAPSVLREQIDAMPKHGPGIAAILDRLWSLWTEGRIPRTVGEHHCFFHLPPGFQILLDDSALRDGAVVATLRVSAVVFSFPGTAKQFALHNAETKALEKFHIDAEFGAPPLVPARIFRSEAELAEHIRLGPKVRIVARIPIPRLIQQSFYWPVSPQAAARFRRLKAEGRDISFDSVEGSDLGRAWENLDG